MLKPYSELRKIDVLPYCDFRDGKDDKGTKIKIPYLNWAKCKDLLHENGAETVYFVPLKDQNGSFVFTSIETKNDKGREGGCYFVSVEVHIDEKVFVMDMPLLNGNLVVYKDTLNQLRISNAHARAFVKGVAIHTGLGFGLWAKYEEETDTPEDLSYHSIMAIKKRIEQTITAKLQGGMEFADILSAMGLSERAFNKIFDKCNDVYSFEKVLNSI